MSVRSIMIILLTVIFGGSAAVGVNTFLRNAPSPAGEVVKVLVAAVDMPRGGNVTSEMLKTKDFLKDMVPAGALTKPEEAIDRAVSIPLLHDEPVLDGKLSPKGAG